MNYLLANVLGQGTSIGNTRTAPYLKVVWTGGLLARWLQKSLSEASEKDMSKLTLAASCQAEGGDGPDDTKDIMGQQGDDLRLGRVRS